MATLIPAFHLLVSALLVLAILVQHRASGLSSTFGGAGSVVVQRRGAERVLFKATIWLSVIFLGLAVARWYIGV